jgi:hypothetical protein
MTELRVIAAILMLLLAAYIVVMNWGCVIVNTRNRRRGIDRHSSMIPLMSVAIAACAYYIYPSADPVWVFIVPLLDLSNWSILWLPFFLILASMKKKQNKSWRTNRP